MGRAGGPGGLSPGQRLGQRVAQSRHDPGDAAQQALEAGAEVGQAAAQLGRCRLAVEATQVTQEVAVGLVVLSQTQFVIEASPHFQVDSGPGQSLRPQPRWVEVRLVERGAQVVQLWKGEGDGEGGGRSRGDNLSPKPLPPECPDTGPISMLGLSVHRPPLSFSGLSSAWR